MIRMKHIAGRAMLIAFVLSSLLFVNMLREAEAAVPLSARVSVDRSKTIGTNRFSLGFVMNNEWDEWSNSATLRTLAADAKFKIVRLWSDRMEPCSRWSESTKTGTFNWAAVDLLVRRIFEVGAEPMICLGFISTSTGRVRVPQGMSTNPLTGLPYDASYAAYAEDWVQHFKAVNMSVRYYQIINEPQHYFGWNGADPVKLQNYIKFFKACADKMKASNPSVRLSNDNTLQKKVLDGFIKNNVALDFLSTSKYDAQTGVSDAEIFNRAETRYITESSSMYGVDKARQVYYNARKVQLPVILTELNFNWQFAGGTDPRIQQVIAVAWLALVIRTCALKNIDSALYQTFATSKSSEMRQPSKGFGFGMVNLDDSKPWYPYYLQKIIGNNLAVGDKLIQANSSSSDIRSLAWLHNGKAVVLLICKNKLNNTVSLAGLQGQLSFQKIDSRVSYLTPSVQSGVLNSGQTLTMQGYSVVLLKEA